MKPMLLILCVLLVPVSAAMAQLDSVWIRTYGGSANDGFRCVLPTTDGGFVAVGYTYSYGPDDVNVFAVKTDDAGDTLWMRTYGGAGRRVSPGIYVVRASAGSVAGSKKVVLVE